MESSLGTGFMAVFAVSGSVVLLAMQAHNRLLSDFMKKMEFEFGTPKEPPPPPTKKKVRFANEVVELPANTKGWPKKHERKAAATGGRYSDENLKGMPLNWQVLYKGILEYKALRCHH